MQSLAVHRSRKLVPEFGLHRPKTLAEARTHYGRHRRIEGASFRCFSEPSPKKVIIVLAG
jgi:hypothetical protein